MGKQRRAREKYHIASVKAAQAAKETGGIEVKQPTENLPGDSLGWKLEPPTENLFKDLDINVEQLNTTLCQDDAVSVRSLAKSIRKNVSREKHMKKQEKRNLRHSLFIRKIDAFYKKLEEDKKKKKSVKKKESKVTEPEAKEGDNIKQEITDKVFSEKPYKIKKEQLWRKVKSIQKTEKRRKAMLAGVEVFKKAFANKKFSSNPLQMITKSIEDKVLNDKL